VNSGGIALRQVETRFYHRRRDCASKPVYLDASAGDAYVFGLISPPLFLAHSEQMSRLSAFARYIKQSIRTPSHPGEQFKAGPDDVYLASYPRSGNTWLRAVIAEIMFGNSGANIADLDRIVPDLHVPPLNDSVIPAKFHAVKTHEPYHHQHRARLKRVIYILRDPRDVAISFYRYSHGLGNYEGTLDAFLTDWLAGRIWPCSWREHVLSWTDAWGAASLPEVIVLRYEDMLQKPEDHVLAIAQFLGYSLDQSRLSEVVLRTTSDEMRRKEKAGMRKTESAKGFQFIGSAKAGGWRNALSERQEALISESLSSLMSRFGYDSTCREHNSGGSRSCAPGTSASAA
jgi:Sulfotransferase domain